MAMDNNPSSKRAGVVFFASVEENSDESAKSEDREQFNSFQENCDEVVQMESENQAPPNICGFLFRMRST
jgi:hypothetical protein